MADEQNLDVEAATHEDPAEKILSEFLLAIPAVRERAAQYTKSAGWDTGPFRTLTAAASDAAVFGHDNMLALVRAALASKPTVTAEEAWADHSVGMAWDSEKHRYGEYRQFLAGFEYRGA